MSGPQNGKYIIKNVAGSQPVIGVDLSGSPEPVPVITEGSDNIWTITKLPDGNYILVLDNFGRAVYIQDHDGNLIGSQTPPPTVWTIEGQPDGSYTILVPSIIRPTRGWTVNNDQPKSPVVLTFVEIPQDNQKWNFTVWPGDE